MADLHEIVAFLDKTLGDVPDRYSSNGLQVEGPSEVRQVGFCVDACEETFTALADCQLVVVHHGIFWPHIARLTGRDYRLVRQLLTQGTALYCSHLPLDKHPELGNNAQLLQQLGLNPQYDFPTVGWTGEFARPRTREAVFKELQTLLGSARLLPFGESKVSRIAVSSGSASNGMVDDARRLGCQLFLTGEASHPIYHHAKEVGMNVVLGGHYATETWGVRALMSVLEKEFAVSTRFVDVPTGF